MLFIDDVILVDESNTRLNDKLVEWRLALEPKEFCTNLKKL